MADLKSMWSGARNMLDLAGCTVTGLDVINQLTRNLDEPREALGAIRAIVVALVEGYQGKIDGKQLETALKTMTLELESAGWISSSVIVEKFRSAL